MKSFINNKNIYRFIILMLLVGLCLRIFLPFLTTLAVAGIFAMVLNPFVHHIQKINIRGYSLQCKKKCAALLLFFLVVLFATPFGLMSSRIYEQAQQFSMTEAKKQQFVVKFSDYVIKAEVVMSNYISKLGFSKSISMDHFSGGLTEKTGNIIFDYVARFIVHIPALIIDFLIFFAALFFFLGESSRIENFFYRVGLFSRVEVNIVEESLRSSSYSMVVSTILAGLVHGLVVSLGAQLVGVGDFSLVFMLTFLLSFIPVIGATLMALGLCVPALAAENYSGALVLLGIALLASAIDNLIRPLFLTYGNKFVHPFVSLLSVLGGIAVFGMSGIFIGPVVVQVAFETFPKLIQLEPQKKLLNEPDASLYLSEN
jgi:predicted PurR-regulated permease PerM